MHWFLKFILEWNSACFGQFSVNHQEFFLLYTQQGHMSYSFRKLSTSLYDIYVYHCCVYSEKFPMMDRGTVRNM
jgi:hypothetical protein